MGGVQEKPNRAAARYGIWQAIREMGNFSIGVLVEASGATRTNVRSFLDRLRDHGYVFAYQSPLRPGVLSFHLERDTGSDYPMQCEVCRRPMGRKCTGAANPASGTASRRSSARNRIWQSMRIFRQFTIADLMRTTGAGRSNVRHFLDRLRNHGYVSTIGRRTAGTHGQMGFRLVKDIGPNYPTRCEQCGRSMGKKCRRQS